MAAEGGVLIATALTWLPPMALTEPLSTSSAVAATQILSRKCSFVIPDASASATPASTGQSVGATPARPDVFKRSRVQTEEDMSMLQQLLEEAEAAEVQEYVPLKKRKAIREQLLKKQLQALSAHLETEEGLPALSESEPDKETQEKQAKQKEAGEQGVSI